MDGSRPPEDMASPDGKIFGKVTGGSEYVPGSWEAVLIDVAEQLRQLKAEQPRQYGSQSLRPWGWRSASMCPQLPTYYFRMGLGSKPLSEWLTPRSIAFA
ncbi:hypothetical protein [Inquilinus ginsengisoli]|jgi:hypothetical protein|uniref:hypothetical protein n=1 Tax=Inquilinus ginsengisoli TaxID=363840 RepID=UPI003D21B0AB